MLFHATYAAVTIFEFCSTKNLRFVCNKRIVHIYNCVHKILIAVITYLGISGSTPSIYVNAYVFDTSSFSDVCYCCMLL